MDDTLSSQTLCWPRPVLILSRAEVASLMRPEDYLEAVRSGFLALAEDRAAAPPPLHLAGREGGLHAKGAFLQDGRAWAAVKVNANFPRNPVRFGLPTIQGAILLFDAEDGSLLAVMDSIEVTLWRTAAASALAAWRLARPDSAVLTVMGCGAQGRAQLVALAALFPLRRVFAWDLHPSRAEAFAREMARRTGLEVIATAGLRRASGASDMIVTCTSARSPLLGSSDVRPGTFIAAVGADSPDKSEIQPRLMARARVVCDSVSQCAAMGDLRHAIAAGAMEIGEVHAELGQIEAGQRAGRESADQITLFDSTGTAVQDVAAAAWIYRRAAQSGAGLGHPLGRP